MAFKDFIATSEGLKLAQKAAISPPPPEARDAAPYTSALGTPVWSNLQFEAGSYVNDEGETINYPNEAGDTLRIDQVLFTVSQAKNIVTTSVNGKIGTVKEYISLNDYVINIRGAITSDAPEVYPTEEVDKLLKVLKAPASLDIVSGFLNRFDINKVVVTGFDTPEREGFRNWQGFTITLLSDEPEELTIKRENN